MEESERTRILNSLSPQEATNLLYDWNFWARKNQLPPLGNWLVWLLLAGRGFGKTRCGAEFVRNKVETGQAKRIALVGHTPAAVRDVMLEGESGLITISPPWMKPIYEPSKSRVEWPNGAVATCFSSYEPDKLRGHNSDLAWADELRTWSYPNETWDALMLGLRAGTHPQCVVTTTPLAMQIIRNLLVDKNCVITRGTTFENRANLPQSFFDQIIQKYEGTTIGLQEIYAEMLDENPDALWKRANILHEKLPTIKNDKGEDEPIKLDRIVVAIDPATTSGKASDKTGIVAAARVGVGLNARYYILADITGRYTPDAWARKSIQLYHELKADRIVAESNQGGEMVSTTLRTLDPTVPIKLVHATKGKIVRAEPIAALYEQKKVFHVQAFTELEDQMCTFTPEIEESPNNMDAMVWAMTELSYRMGGSVITWI